MKLSELLLSAGYTPGAELTDCEITEIVTDSRRATYNSMFICLSGSEGDGHSHTREALLKGAACVVIERGVPNDLPPTRKRVSVITCDSTREAAARLYSAWYGHPSRRMKLIAVTGTNGKTSVSVMLKAIFEAAFYKCGIIGTVACYSGKRQIFAEPDDPLANMTTPDPKQLYRMLAFMAADRVDCVFIEASSHALKLRKLDAIEFDCGVFTNIGADHMDFHKTAEDYLASKLRILRLCKKALVNADSAYAGRIWKEAEKRCSVKSYSADGRAADFVAEDPACNGAGGICYTLRSKNTVMRVESPIPGEFTVDNTLCAASCALMMGISHHAVQSALSSLSGVEGRVERIKSCVPVNFSVYIDYAHTPDALEKLLRSFNGMKRGKNGEKHGRTVLVFGCGGDRDRTKRPEMGRIASLLADRCIITSDNSRGEKTEDIISDIMSGFDTDRDHAVIPDRREAIENAIREAHGGDIIILAGKGHEKYEIDQSGRHEFDEKNIVLEAINKYYGR